MESALLLQKSFKLVNDLLTGLPKTMFFHNQQHTVDVFLVATEIALREGIKPKDILAVQLAALFHDTGYLYSYTEHEEKSKQIAADFLLQENCEEALIKQVAEAIDATRIPQCPHNEVECILCDADLFHLAKPDYGLYGDRLRREWAIHLNLRYTDEEWTAFNLGFLQTHSYYTQYGQTVLQRNKLKNMLSD